MSQFIEAPVRADTCTGAVAKYLRVKTPAAVALAGALDIAHGTMEKDVFAAGPCSVRLRSCEGTKKMVAAAAITAGSYVYGAASGNISSVAIGNVVGVALEAAAANNDVIEVMPVNAPIFNQVIAYAANGALAIVNGTATLTKAGVNAMTLAAPTVDQEGLILRIISQTANAHTITATGLIDDGVVGGSKTTATFAAFAGASIELVASNLKWAVLAKNAVTIS
jgi:hypothetical protein